MKEVASFTVEYRKINYTILAVHTSAPLRPQNFSQKCQNNLRDFLIFRTTSRCDRFAIFAWFWWKNRNHYATFCWGNHKKLLSNYRYLQNFANIPGAWRRNRDEKRFFGRYVSPTPTPRHKDRSDDASADSFRRVVHPLAPVLVVAVGDVDGADLVKGLVQRSSIRQTLQGSFAALSKPSFARKILIWKWILSEKEIGIKGTWTKKITKTEKWKYWKLSPRYCSPISIFCQNKLPTIANFAILQMFC